MNAVTCLTCNTRIESKHRHDFVGCKCHAGSATWVAVDGGNDYKRRCFGPKARWLDDGGRVWVDGEPTNEFVCKSIDGQGRVFERSVREITWAPESRTALKGLDK